MHGEFVARMPEGGRSFSGQRGDRTMSTPQAKPALADTRGRLSWLGALLRQRCPNCRKGRMFRSLLEMNDPCPVCGQLFQREEGYFLGAMYASYALATGLLIPLYLIAALLLPNQNSL